MVCAGMLYFFQMFLCLRCHHRLAHMMVRGLPAVGRILPTRHQYHQLWPRLSLPWSMPLQIIRASCAKWRAIVPTARRQSSSSRTAWNYIFGILWNLTPLFIKAEEPLEADEWVRVMEQKFGLIWCTETQKPLIAAQQLRGPASTWWTNFSAIQPAGHQITWEEFKLIFREHYVPKGVLHMKQE